MTLVEVMPQGCDIVVSYDYVQGMGYRWIAKSELLERKEVIAKHELMEEIK